MSDTKQSKLVSIPFDTLLELEEIRQHAESSASASILGKIEVKVTIRDIALHCIKVGIRESRKSMGPQRKTVEAQR